MQYFLLTAGRRNGTTHFRHRVNAQHIFLLSISREEAIIHYNHVFQKDAVLKDVCLSRIGRQEYDKNLSRFIYKMPDI